MCLFRERYKSLAVVRVRENAGAQVAEIFLQEAALPYKPLIELNE